MVARWRVVAERKDMGTEEPAVDPGVASFVRACDEVLEFHERAGSSEGAAARQVRAKREELLNDSRARPADVPASAGGKQGQDEEVDPGSRANPEPPGG